MIYYLIFLLITLGAIFESFGIDKTALLGRRGTKYSWGSLCFTFFAFYLYCLIAFRDSSVATDTTNYLSFFNHINTDADWERGFIYLNVFVHNISSNAFWLLQIIVATTSCLTYYGHMKKRSLFPICTLFAFFMIGGSWRGQFEGMRQSMAISILILGVRFIEQKSLIKWIMIIALAMQFHVTSCMAFPLYFTSRITIKPWFAFLLLVFSVWMTYFGLFIIEPILNFTVMLGILPARFARLVVGYMTSDFNEQAEFGTGLGYLLRAMFYFYMILLYKMSPLEDRKKCYMLNFLIAIILTAFARNYNIFRRLVYYYDVSGLGLASYGLYAKQNKFFRRLEWVQVVMLCLVLAFFIWTKLRGWTQSDMADYKTFLTTPW